MLAAASDKLPRAQPFSSDCIFSTPECSADQLLATDPAWAQRLLGRYGNAAIHLLTQASDDEHQRIGETDFCLAECRWALRHEAVEHLDDLLLRRTRLGMLLADGGETIFPQLETLCTAELGWSNEQWTAEVSRYQGIWRRYYSLPHQ